MKDFGKKLKSAREAKGFSLELVHSRLKITPYQLEALENMEPEKFHAMVYFIGSLRRYAFFLDIDPNETINLYTQKLESAAQKSQLSIEKNEQLTSTKKESNKNPSSPLALIVVAAIVALLALSVPVAMFIFGKMKPLILNNTSSSVKISTAALASTAYSSAVDGVSGCDTIKNVSMSDMKDNEKNTAKKSSLESGVDQLSDTKSNLHNTLFKRHNQENYLLNQDGSSAGTKVLQLKVVGLDNSWVRVTSDKKILFEGTINKGNQKVFSTNDKFYLKLGNESGVDVYLNGRKVDLGDGKKTNGKVKELEFTLKDINGSSK